MMYDFVNTHRVRYSVRRLCKALKVSESSFYAAPKRGVSLRKRRRDALLNHISIVFGEHKRRYGSPRVTKALKAKGIACSENQVASLMRENGLRAKMKKRFVRTTDSNHSLPLATDLVQQDFTASKPDELWLSDITYIRTREGWVYLSAILDVYSRKIVGWSIKNSLSEELVHEALDMAFYYRNLRPGLVFHSDRGSQYASTRVRLRLKYEGITQSMSRKGNCYDNAMMESFFSTIKRELIYGEPIYEDRYAANKAIKDYIENYYNRKRIHSGIGYMSPVQFEQMSLLT